MPPSSLIALGYPRCAVTASDTKSYPDKVYLHHDLYAVAPRVTAQFATGVERTNAIPNYGPESGICPEQRNQGLCPFPKRYIQTLAALAARPGADSL